MMKLSIKMGTCELALDDSSASVTSGHAQDLILGFRSQVDRFVELEHAQIAAKSASDALSLQLADKYARDQAKPDPFDALRIEVCRTAIAYTAEGGPGFGFPSAYAHLHAAVQALVNEQGIVLPAEGE